MEIGRLKENVFSWRWTNVACLVAGFVMLDLVQCSKHMLLKTIQTKCSLNTGEEGPNVLVRATEIIASCILPNELIRILSSEIILNDRLANNDVSQEYLFPSFGKRNSAAYASQDCELHSRVA